MMTIELKRIDDAYLMEATNENGNTMRTDGSPAIGGGNQAMRPMQLMLVGLGGCSSIDIIMLMKKMRQPLEDIQIKVEGEREEGKTPALFTTINVHFTLKGDLDVEKTEKIIAMSMEKYCSVAKIIEKTAKITSSYEIIK